MAAAAAAAAAARLLVFLLHLFITAAAGPTSSGQDVAQTRPHLAGCVSTNMETFRCRWNVGAFQNLSEPGALRLFYYNKKPFRPQAWSECPHYSTERPNECFFNQSHTTVWTPYRVQLRSADRAVLYDEIQLDVQDIVQPDPPVYLNWTLLNVSVTGTHYDVQLSWMPPQSADVETGWMRLQYEVQHRDVASNLWKAVDLVTSTHRYLYGLQTNVNNEMRVRCKMFGRKDFGGFSDSVFVHIPSKVSRFPIAALLIFGAFCLVAVLMLVLISQQEKLMFFLLPPVPGPKIRGIDPKLLKKGKLRELRSILGGPPDLRPELYNNDSWVEFIDLDMEEQSDRLMELDNDCLVDRSLSSHCSPLSVGGFRDDDSGRASCCDPDLPLDPEASPFLPLILNQSLGREPSFPVVAVVAAAAAAASEPSSPTAAEPPSVAPGREALYTQVSEVRSSGEVLLSPEEQTEDGTAEKGKEKNDFQLVAVNSDHGGYTSELNVGKLCAKLSRVDPAGGRASSPPSPYYESDAVAVSPPPLELYNNDPWVEFIDLDMEEQSDRLMELDTDCLVDRSLPSHCSPLSVGGFRDDDSGRASCCDPDLPVDPEASPFLPLILNQSLGREPSLPVEAAAAASEPSSPTAAEPPSVAPGREALYTQVSEVRSSGEVLLSPEEQTEDGTAEKGKEKNDFQLVAVNSDHGGYTSELNVGKLCAKLSRVDPAGGRTSSPPSPYYESDAVAVSPPPSAPVYTVVEGVDVQNSLVLTPSSTPAPQLIIPKFMPAPDGYLPPDLLGSVTP